MFTLDKTNKTAEIKLLGLLIYIGPWFIDVWSAKKAKKMKDFVLISIGK